MLNTNDQPEFSDDEVRGKYISIFIEIESQLKAIIVQSLSYNTRIQNRIRGILLSGVTSSHLIGLFENLLDLSGKSKAEKGLIERLKELNRTRNLFAHAQIMRVKGAFVFIQDDRKRNFPRLKAHTEEDLQDKCLEMMNIFIDLNSSSKALAKRIRKAIDSEIGIQ